MKTFWQHANGLIYVVESDTFGQITGAAGPADSENLRDPSEYKCGPGILAWLKRAVAEQKLRRIDPVLPQDAPASPVGKPPKPAIRSRKPILPIESPEAEEPPDPVEEERARRRKFAWSSAYHL